VATTPILLSLGSNLGDRAANLRAAIAGLGRFMHVTAVSPLYDTAPMYVTDQPAFLNVAVTAETALRPHDLLRALKALEARLGRVTGRRYGPRVIDLDIVMYGGEAITTDDLTIPHERMTERAFVLIPASDIAGDWVHPIDGRSIRALSEALGSVDDLVRREDLAA